MAYIWFMWIYSFLILRLECGLSGFLNFNNILCGLFVAFVDLYKSLLLKSTCDMVLMWFHVDSISIYTLKSQSSLSFKPNFRDGSKEWADSFTKGHLIGYQVWFCICGNKFFSFWVHQKHLSCYYTTSYWHKYNLNTATLIMNQLSEHLYN